MFRLNKHRLNAFSFVNKAVGWLLRIFYIEKSAFLSLKSFFRVVYNHIKGGYKRYRSHAYRRRAYYRKNNRNTLLFNRLFNRSRINMVFTEHSKRNKFSLRVRRSRLRQTFVKKFVISKYLIKYYKVNKNFFRGLQKNTKSLYKFVKYFEYRLDFFLVNQGFISSLNLARLYIKQGKIIVNFSCCINLTYIVGADDII